MQKEENAITKWISKGCHHDRQILAHALRRPMTASELFVSARQQGFEASFWVVVDLLNNLIKQGLVYRITRRRITGNVFFWTRYGKREALAAGIHVEAIQDNFDWHSYACVVSGKLRRAILLTMNKPPADRMNITAEQIRRTLSTEKSIGLRSVTRNLPILRDLGLLKNAGKTNNQRRNLYCITEKGRQIAQRLMESPLITETLRSARRNVSPTLNIL